MINDVIKVSVSNGHISATDRPIDFVFDPMVGFSGTADRLDLLPVVYQMQDSAARHFGKSRMTISQDSIYYETYGHVADDVTCRKW